MIYSVLLANIEIFFSLEKVSTRSQDPLHQISSYRASTSSQPSQSEDRNPRKTSSTHHQHNQELAGSRKKSCEAEKIEAACDRVDTSHWSPSSSRTRISSFPSISQDSSHQIPDEVWAMRGELFQIFKYLQLNFIIMILVKVLFFNLKQSKCTKQDSRLFV